MKCILHFVVMVVMVFPTQHTIAQKNRQKKKEFSVKPLNLTDEEKYKVDNYFLEGEKFYLIKNLPKAIVFFEKTIAFDANNAAAHYKLAQIYSENNEQNRALPYAWRARLLQPKNKYYHLLLTHIQTSLGDLQAAESSFVTLLDIIPGTESSLFDLAALQLYQKKYDEALETYKKAEKHFGQMEQISIQMQQVYLKQNKLALAIDEGKKLVHLYPEEPSYVLSLAQIMLSNNKFVEAEQFLLDNISNYQNNDHLYIFLSEAYAKQNKFDKAIEMLQVPFASPYLDITRKIKTMAGYLAMLPNESLNRPLIALSQRLIATHPQSYQTLAMMGDLHYNIGEKEQAKNYYLQAVHIDASNFSIWQNILSLDFELEAYELVIEHANDALSFFPNQASLYYFGGTAYLIKKEYEQAVKMFNQGKIYASQDSNLSSLFHGQLGDIYNSLNQHDKSDAAYEIALKAKPDNDHVLNNYSYFLTLRKKDLDKALTMSKQLVKNYPTNSTYLDTHAWVLYMLGDFKNAEKYLALAIQYDASAIIIEHYGDVLFKLGKTDAAVIQWKHAREQSNDTTTLDKKITERKLNE